MQVHLECAGVFQTLFVVNGSCQGLEISLDVDSVTFGAVVQNSSSARQFVMNNTGDIGARFVQLAVSTCLRDCNYIELVTWLHLRATELCLSYGITECYHLPGYQPPDIGERKSL